MSRSIPALLQKCAFSNARLQNFEMQVGTVATVVEVVSDAEALLATTSSAIGDVLPEFEVTSLPLKPPTPMLAYIASIC